MSSEAEELLKDLKFSIEKMKNSDPRIKEFFETLLDLPSDLRYMNYHKFVLGLKYFIENNSYPLTINYPNTPSMDSINTITFIDEQGITIGYVESTVSCKLVSKLCVVNTTTNTKTDIDVDSMIHDLMSPPTPVYEAIFDTLLENPKSAIE